MAAGTENKENVNEDTMAAGRRDLTPTEFPLNGKLTVREILGVIASWL